MLGSVCRFGWLAPALICGSVLLWPVRQSPSQAQFFVSSRFELSDSVAVDQADTNARKHLERVDACLADEQWDVAVETLRQVLANHGSKVIELTTGRYISVRDYCHLRIAALPPAALDLYRGRVDGQAQQWYQQAAATRDRELLLRVVDQFFSSSYADQALMALGEIALEHGDHSAARDYWEKLIESAEGYHEIPGRIFEAARQAEGLPNEDALLLDRWYEPQGTDDSPKYTLQHTVLRPDEIDRRIVRFWNARGLLPTRLAYPQTDLPLADVRARMVLASIMEGSHTRAHAELEALKELHPGAAGKIGGRSGSYAELLGNLLTASVDWPVVATRQPWNTFAGGFTRNPIVPHGLELGALKWHRSLEKAEIGDSQAARSYGFSPRRVAEDDKALLSYHPVVVGDIVFVAGQNRIAAFDLQTGEPAWGNENGVVYRHEDDSVPKPHTRSSSLGAPRFTLTVHDNKLLARMGSAITSSAAESPFSNAVGQLVCLDLQRQGSLIWKIKPDDADDKWSFEGAPVADGGHVYIAMRRSDIRPQAYVACFDAETGKRRWRRLVCSAETPGRGQADEMTHNLLTLHRDTIYINTNLGAVAALAARDGEIRWISLYERAAGGELNRQAKHFYRDLTPCIYDRGRLFVAPSDTERIFALNAQTGELLWKSADQAGADAVHLLGVYGNRLLASGDKLWWFNAEGGKGLYYWPDTDTGLPRGFGRGLIAGNEVFWGTRDEIYRFDLTTRQRTGTVRLTDRGAGGGNMVLAGNRLLIAAGETLYAFENDMAEGAAPPIPSTEANSTTHTPAPR